MLAAIGPLYFYTLQVRNYCQEASFAFFGRNGYCCLYCVPEINIFAVFLAELIKK